MKKLSRFNGWMIALSLMASGLLWTSCNKNDQGGNTGSNAAGLMAFNLAPDKPAVSLALSGSVITNVPLGFVNYTGVYLGIYPGTRQVQSYDYNNGNPIYTSTGTFQAGKFYSLFVVGANSNYQHVLVEDVYDSLNASSGEAFVRYVNAIPDSSAPVVNMISAGTEVLNEPASYRHVSEFRAVAPGSLDVAISNGSNIQASRTITVTASKAYTILLAGLPGSADPAAAVQIRFVENGTLTSDNAQQRASSTTSLQMQ